MRYAVPGEGQIVQQDTKHFDEELLALADATRQVASAMTDAALQVRLTEMADELTMLANGFRD